MCMIYNLQGSFIQFNQLKYLQIDLQISKQRFTYNQQIWIKDKQIMDDQNLVEQNSLSENLNNLENQLSKQLIEEQVQQIDYTTKIEHVHQMISKLSEEEEILKQTLKNKQRQLLDTFKLLDDKKQLLRSLVLQQFNRQDIHLDVGLSEEFQSLKNTISNQRKEIEQLKDQLAKQGLSGRNNDQDFIRVFTKIPEIEKQIQIGRKFASTQYVRDYFDKPQVYKVAYEQVKYEFQIRAKIKESLELQKQNYLKKKDEIYKATIRQKQIEQQLLKEKDTLLKQLKSLS